MAEGSVPYIMAERYRLDKVKIKPERLSDSSRYSWNKLNVEGTTGDVVVFIEREDLCLVGIAVVIGAVYYLVYVMDKCCTPYARLVSCSDVASVCVFLIKSNGRNASVFSIRYYFGFDFFGKCFVSSHIHLIYREIFYPNYIIYSRTVQEE